MRATLVLAVVLLMALMLPARSNTTGVWTGVVVYVNTTHIGVKSHSETRDFLLDSNTAYFENADKSSHAALQTGMTVSVSYTRSTVFGSTRATRVDISSFALPLPKST